MVNNPDAIPETQVCHDAWSKAAVSSDTRVERFWVYALRLDETFIALRSQAPYQELLLRPAAAAQMAEALCAAFASCAPGYQMASFLDALDGVAVEDFIAVSAWSLQKADIWHTGYTRLGCAFERTIRVQGPDGDKLASDGPGCVRFIRLQGVTSTRKAVGTGHEEGNGVFFTVTFGTKASSMEASFSFEIAPGLAAQLARALLHFVKPIAPEIGFMTKRVMLDALAPAIGAELSKHSVDGGSRMVSEFDVPPSNEESRPRILSIPVRHYGCSSFYTQRDVPHLSAYLVPLRGTTMISLRVAENAAEILVSLVDGASIARAILTCLSFALGPRQRDASIRALRGAGIAGLHEAIQEDGTEPYDAMVSRMTQKHLGSTLLRATMTAHWTPEFQAVPRGMTGSDDLFGLSVRVDAEVISNMNPPLRRNVTLSGHNEKGTPRFKTDMSFTSGIFAAFSLLHLVRSHDDSLLRGSIDQLTSVLERPWASALDKDYSIRFEGQQRRAQGMGRIRGSYKPQVFG